MKQIGHIDGATTETAWKTHTLGMLSPHDLFIPNPGERENVNADHWTHVGWVDPDKDGGQIWGSHAEAGDNSRPAYVQRDTMPTGMIVADGPIRFERLPKYGETGGVVGQVDPMDVRRSEFERLDRAVKDLFLAVQPKPGKVDLTPEQVDKVVAKLTMSKEYGKLPSTIPTSELLSEATEFCNEELDRFDGLDFDSDAEVGCQRSATYIRELVRRFPAEPAPSVAAERPMTFYDHAFIHAAVNHADYYSGSTMTQAVIDDAHEVASMLTRNRANRT